MVKAKKLHSVEAVAGTRTVDKTDLDLPHLLHDEPWQMGNSFSYRLIPPKARQNASGSLLCPLPFNCTTRYQHLNNNMHIFIHMTSTYQTPSTAMHLLCIFFNVPVYVTYFISLIVPVLYSVLSFYCSPHCLSFDH